MSALDRAIAERQPKRAKDDAEREARLSTARGFLEEFHEADAAGSRRLKAHGPMRPELADARRNRPVAEIMSHFSL